MATLMAMTVWAIVATTPSDADGRRRADESLALSRGDWVEYRVRGGADARTSYWRAAVVDEERDAAGAMIGHWVEIELAHHESFLTPLFQIKILVASAGEHRVKRAFFAWGVEPIRELSPSAVERIFSPGFDRRERGTRSGLPMPTSVRTLRPGKVMTGAGTIAATATEARVGPHLVQRIWTSPEVPLLGLARLEMPSIAHEVDLRGYGHDAKPRMELPDSRLPTISLERGALPPSVLAPVEEALASTREAARAP